jgi:hypothetical protein
LLLIESHFSNPPAWRDLGLTEVLSCKRKWLSEIQPAAVLAHAGPVVLDYELGPAEVPSAYSPAAVKAFLAETKAVRQAAKRRPRSRRGPLLWYPGFVMGRAFNPLNPASGEPIRRAAAVLQWAGVYDHFDGAAVDAYARWSGAGTDADLTARFDADWRHSLHVCRDIIGKPAYPYVAWQLQGDGPPLPPAVWRHVCGVVRGTIADGSIPGAVLFCGWTPQGALTWTDADAAALEVLRAAAAGAPAAGGP